MEVLQSDDKLREEILNDARTKAERLLKKSSTEIKEMEEKAKKDIERFEEENKNNFEKFIIEEKEKIFASIDIDFKKRSLKIVNDIMESVFEEFKNSIINNKEKYKKLIEKLIINSFEILTSKNYEIEIDKKEIGILGEDFLNNLKNKFKFNFFEKEKINGIIVYNSQRNKQVFISLDKFIEDLKDKERVKIYNIIFKD